MNTLQIILIIIGVWQIVISFTVNTKNFQSALFFKIIPFLSGCYCIFYAILLSGIISIK